MYIRPVTLDDHAAVLSLAEQAGIGMTSLPPDAEVLRDKIERAVASFDGTVQHEADESYLFVLVDPEHDQVVGICGIVSHVGLKQPFYSYKLSTMTQASESLDIFSKHQVLHVVNDYTGASEIGSLYLSPEYRRDRIGRFLSRVRFLFMAQFPEKFDEKVIAEIRGMHDREGDSPFYDSLARPFFQMDFHKADYVNATQGNQFIADLMPKYPIYVSLLPVDAQQSVGRPYPSSEAAKALLEREGFYWNEYLDIFDGGPTMEVRLEEIKTSKESQVTVVDGVLTGRGEKFIVMNEQLAGFRATVGRLAQMEDGSVQLSERVMEVLGVKQGDTVRFVKA